MYLLEKMVGNFRIVDCLDLGINSEVDRDLLEGLNPSTALAIAADHGTLASARRAADLAIETGAVVAHLHRLHDRVAKGILRVPHFRARAVSGSIARRAVDLAESLALRAGHSTSTVAALAVADALRVGDRHLLPTLLEIRRPGDRQIPRTGRLAPVIDCTAVVRNHLALNCTVLVLRPQADRVGRTGHNVLYRDLAAKAPDTEETLGTPLIDEAARLGTIERRHQFVVGFHDRLSFSKSLPASDRFPFLSRSGTSRSRRPFPRRGTRAAAGPPHP